MAGDAVDRAESWVSETRYDVEPGHGTAADVACHHRLCQALCPWLANFARSPSRKVGTCRHFDGPVGGDGSAVEQGRSGPCVRTRSARGQVRWHRPGGQASIGPRSPPWDPHARDDRPARRWCHPVVHRDPGHPTRGRRRQPCQRRVQQCGHRDVPELAPRRAGQAVVRPVPDRPHVRGGQARRHEQLR